MPPAPLKVPSPLAALSPAPQSAIIRVDFSNTLWKSSTEVLALEMDGICCIGGMEPMGKNLGLEEDIARFRIRMCLVVERGLILKG